MSRKPAGQHECCLCVEPLEADVRELKKQLAARGIKPAVVKRDSGDPFAHLAPADAEWWRRKTGGGRHG